MGRIMENKDYSPKTYTKNLISESIKEIKSIFKDMYAFARLTFSKNLMENIERERANRLESELEFPLKK